MLIIELVYCCEERRHLDRVLDSLARFHAAGDIKRVGTNRAQGFRHIPRLQATGQDQRVS